MRYGFRVKRSSLLVSALLLVSATAGAHEPVAKCTAVDTTTIRCKGGHSDGSGAPAAKIDVISHTNEVLIAAKLDGNSTLTFERPGERFYVVLDVGPGHMVIVEDDEIG